LRHSASISARRASSEQNRTHSQEDSLSAPDERNREGEDEITPSKKPLREAANWYGMVVQLTDRPLSIVSF
jgi:hypothetical protein